jgi:hypothetical protein
MNGRCHGEPLYKKGLIQKNASESAKRESTPVFLADRFFIGGSIDACHHPKQQQAPANAKQIYAIRSQWFGGDELDQTQVQRKKEVGEQHTDVGSGLRIHFLCL